MSDVWMRIVVYTWLSCGLGGFYTERKNQMRRPQSIIQNFVMKLMDVLVLRQHPQVRYWERALRILMDINIIKFM